MTLVLLNLVTILYHIQIWVTNRSPRELNVINESVWYHTLFGPLMIQWLITTIILNPCSLTVKFKELILELKMKQIKYSNILTRSDSRSGDSIYLTYTNMQARSESLGNDFDFYSTDISLEVFMDVESMSCAYCDWTNNNCWGNCPFFFVS